MKTAIVWFKQIYDYMIMKHPGMPRRNMKVPLLDDADFVTTRYGFKKT
jgi:hypothetical protein